MRSRILFASFFGMAEKSFSTELLKKTPYPAIFLQPWGHLNSITLNRQVVMGNRTLRFGGETRQKTAIGGSRQHQPERRKEIES
jgi:hypothetical protein